MMMICMVDTEVEGFQEIRRSREREVLLEYKEKFLEEKAFRSENVNISKSIKKQAKTSIEHPDLK